jgi:hypothetical protein
VGINCIKKLGYLLCGLHERGEVFCKIAASLVGVCADYKQIISERFIVLFASELNPFSALLLSERDSELLSFEKHVSI